MSQSRCVNNISYRAYDILLKAKPVWNIMSQSRFYPLPDVYVSIEYKYLIPTILTPCNYLSTARKIPVWKFMSQSRNKSRYL
jgi:hypothetical protein